MSLKILLADDSLTAQNMGKKILTDAGYEVIAVSNGAQAIKKIVSDLPDLVVLDVYMPGYSGVELCERMRQTRETATTPVVLSVGKMEPFRPEETTRVRADGLIIKPFEASELLAVVKKLAEKVAAAPPRRKSARPEPVPEQDIPAQEHAAVGAEPATTPEQTNGSFDIPQELAANPAIGMELIVEASGPVSGTDQPPAPAAFEVEQPPEASAQESHPGPQMESTGVLSGVFEMEPVAATQPEGKGEAPAEEDIERFSAAVEIPSQTSEELRTTSPEPLVPAPRSEQPQAAEAAFESTPNFPVNAFAEPQSSAPGAGEDFKSAPAEASFSDLPNADSPLENVPEREQPEPVPSPAWDVMPAQAAHPVWVAEEIRLDPEDCTIPLHEEMRQASRQAEATTASMDLQRYTDFDRQVEWTPAPAVAPGNQDPSGQEREYFRPDFSVEEMATPQPSWPEPPPAFDSPTELHSSSVSQSEPAPEKIRSVQEMAAEEAAAAAATAPHITSAVPDPARIASIVDQVLERLKPELIAAVTRELEKKH